MRDRYVAGATPEWRISLYWHASAKCWVLVVQDRDGLVVERQTSTNRGGIDRAAARLLLRGLTNELDALLPL